MKILTNWLREYVPGLTVDDRQLAEDLTLHGIAVEGVFDVGAGSLFEMDITTNRVDAMNHYGIAREAAAIYGVPLLPLDTALPQARVGGPFPVRIEAPELCGRFTARVLRGVTIAPSSGEVAERFRLLEQKQIANAVDATNYVTMAMGHPTHAFDLDKVEGGLVVRRARAGERLKLLDGTERTLTADDLVVADERKALALAGVMGGWDTMITPATKNVLVEAAWFDPAAVRQSARRHGLHTDASHRFERGADFAAPPEASALVSRLILAAGGEIEGGLVDVVVQPWAARTVERPPVGLSLGEVRRILGKTMDGYPLDDDAVERTLTALGAKVESAGSQAYLVTLPSWRLDLEREIDLIEEIARLHGYNRFANTLPAFAGSVVELASAAQERQVRSRLLGAGYTEAIGSTFCSVADAVTFAAQPGTEAPLGNPLNEEAGCLRTSLLPAMLAMLAHNLNREVATVRLFEMGTVFARAGSGAIDRVLERPSLAIGATGEALAAGAMAPGREYGFYDLKGIVEELLDGFAIQQMGFDTFPAGDGLMPAWLEPGQSARIVADGETLGYLGELARSEAERRKLRQAVFLGELDLERLFRHGLRSSAVRELSRYPAVVRDFSFQFPDTVGWQAVESAMRGLEIAEMRSIEPHEIFRDKKTAGYSMLVRAVFQAQDRTLRLEELHGWAQRIFAALIELGATPRFPLELLQG